MSALYDQIGTTYGRFRRSDPRVAAVEPSRTMIAQRPRDPAPVVQAVAGHLPFPDRAFNAALAVLTAHHWPDAHRGLAEMQRVASRQVVMTWDRAVSSKYWLIDDYLPEIAGYEETYATVDTIAAALNATDIRAIPVPHDCVDGFMAAYWRRPERYLDSDARAAISGIALIDQTIVERAMGALADDLASGAWHRRHADLLDLDELDAGYRLVVADG